MTLKVPNASEVSLLNFALGATVPGNQKIKLFINNVTPGNTDVLATYTEMSTQGYTDKTLTKTSWVTVSGPPATSTYAQQTWTFDGTGGSTTVYGYMITDVTSGLLLWAETFTSAKTVVNNGDQIKITPTITLT